MNKIYLVKYKSYADSDIDQSTYVGFFLDKKEANSFISNFENFLKKIKDEIFDWEENRLRTYPKPIRAKWGNPFNHYEMIKYQNQYSLDKEIFIQNKFKTLHLKRYLYLPWAMEKIRLLVDNPAIAYSLKVITISQIH